MAISLEKRRAVWKEAKPAGQSTTSKRDPYGLEIIWGYHGDNMRGGWAVDHIIPEALGGSDHINNLQALDFAKNQQLGDSLVKKTRYGDMKPVVANSIKSGVFINGKKCTLQQLKTEYGMIK